MGKLSKSASTDLELVNAIRTADGRESTRAFNKLFSKYHDAVLYHFRGLVNDEEVAQELVNDAFLKASQNLDKFNADTAAFSTWFFKLSKNVFIDRTRAKAAEARKGSVVSLSDLVVVDNESNSMEFNLECPDNTPEKEIIVAERNKKIAEIISKINKPVIRKVLMMRFYDGMSYEEISDSINIPKGTVKGLLFRAKQVLKEKFEEAHIGY